MSLYRIRRLLSLNQTLLFRRLLSNDTIMSSTSSEDNNVKYIKTTVEDGDGTKETTRAENENIRVDASLPNKSWTPEALKLYEKFDELTKTGNWKRHKTMYTVGLETRPFMKAIHESPGKQFEYAFFCNKEEQIMKGFVQFGPWLQGGTMMVHGGAELTLLDSLTGVLCYSVYPGERFVTVNLNGNFKNILFLNTVAVVEAKVIRRDGRKVYLEGCIKNPDDDSIYCEATCIFLKVGESSL